MTALRCHEKIACCLWRQVKVAGFVDSIWRLIGRRRTKSPSLILQFFIFSKKHQDGTPLPRQARRVLPPGQGVGLPGPFGLQAPPARRGVRHLRHPKGGRRLLLRPEGGRPVRRSGVVVAGAGRSVDSYWR